jgi:hypothetical protein
MSSKKGPKGRQGTHRVGLAHKGQEQIKRVLEVTPSLTRLSNRSW